MTSTSTSIVIRFPLNKGDGNWPTREDLSDAEVRDLSLCCRLSIDLDGWTFLDQGPLPLRRRPPCLSPEFGGMDASLMARMKELEEENRRLKKLYVEAQIKADIVAEARRPPCLSPEGI